MGYACVVWPVHDFTLCSACKSASESREWACDTGRAHGKGPRRCVVEAPVGEGGDDVG